jgi:hypothetical protein
MQHCLLHFRLYNPKCLLYMLEKWNEERDRHYDQKDEEVQNHYK